jgi:kinetochore-associated protein 1
VDIQSYDDEFFVLCTNGKIYKIYGIDEKAVEQNQVVSDDTTQNINESFVLPVQIERVSNNRFTSVVQSFCVVDDAISTFFIVCSKDYIAIIENEHLMVHLECSEEYGSVIKVINLDHYVIGLTDKNDFVEICPYVGLMRKLELDNEAKRTLSNLTDLRVLDANNDFIELLVLSQNENDERDMIVIDFPSMKSKSTLVLPGISWIVSQPKSSVNMYFIAGYKNDNNFVQSIELKSITETDPEQRFKKLLLKGHFEEAEKYATACELKLEPLHQARVYKTLSQLSKTKTLDELDEKFALLMKQIVYVEDKDFLLSLRNTNGIPNRTYLAQFLEYLLKNIDTLKYQDETNDINENLLRLETLRLIDPFDTNMNWMKFLTQKDMQSIAMDYFKTDVLMSCLIWSRHSSSIIPKLNISKLYAWLHNIRSTVEPFQLIQWLKHFAPCFLQMYPNETTHLVEWCLERTKSLQFSPSWPEIGLEFINNIKTIFKEIEFLFVDVRRSYHCNLEKIQKLINVLEEMVVLRKTYHLTMSLDDYSKNSIEETGFKLLQRIQLHNLRKMVNDFLYPIFYEHGIVPEETLVKYIGFLASNRNLGYWQDRAVVAIDLLHNEENRLNCALTILKVSPVPWSTVVLPLAKLGTSSNHPLANLIFIEYKNQSIKIIKTKYGWPVDYFDLQQDRIKLALRIMKVNGVDMIADVVKLVDSSPDIAYDAYFFLIHNLVKSGRIDEFVDLVTSIEKKPESSHQLFEKTLNVMLKEIEGDLHVDDIQNYIDAVTIILGRLRDSIDDFKYEYHSKQIQNVKRIVQIRREFKFDIRLNDLKRAESKNEWIKLGIKMIAENIVKSSSIEKMWNQINLLSNLLNNNTIELYVMLSKELNNIFITCKIVEWLIQTVDDFKHLDVENALKLILLMISQQMAYLDNNAYQMKQPYDPLTFPLAYEFLVKCLTKQTLSHNETILELMGWVGIIRSYYPLNVVDTTKSERIIGTKVFTSNLTNGHSKSNGDRRESLSIFDNFEEKVVVQQTQQAEDYLSPILQCVCCSLKIISFVINSNAFMYKFIRCHAEDEKIQR